MKKRSWLWIGLAFVAGVVIMGGIAFLLTNIQTHKNEQAVASVKITPIGEKELENGTVSVRDREDQDLGSMSVADFVAKLVGESAIPF